MVFTNKQIAFYFNCGKKMLKRNEMNEHKEERNALNQWLIKSPMTPEPAQLPVLLESGPQTGTSSKNSRTTWQ
jgi:hypothetical protein